jgi:hypothetical protein
MVSRDESLFAGAETLAVSRKKALLGLLAEREAERTGTGPSDAEVAELARSFRERFGLATDEAFESWLEAAGLSREGWLATMRTFATITRLEALLGESIDELARDQRAVWTAHAWATRGSDAA